MPDPETTRALLAHWRQRVDQALVAALPDERHDPRRLHAAMRHAVLLGGKRMRPLLVYATGTAFGLDAGSLDAPAVAVELVHAYSLVHDDLPAMDDDALRRGQPTVHVAYGEATAILTGDALQALAFAQLAGSGFDAQTRIAMVGELADASGVAGMCGGQALDIAVTGAVSTTDIAALERLHAMKTGALLRASVRLGAIAAGADGDARAHLDRYAQALGLAFQIRDDLLDIEGDSATLGKTAGKDAVQDKATFPALIGMDASRMRLRELAARMQAELEAFDGNASALGALARLVVDRDR